MRKAAGQQSGKKLVVSGESGRLLQPICRARSPGIQSMTRASCGTTFYVYRAGQRGSRTRLSDPSPFTLRPLDNIHRSASEYNRPGRVLQAAENRSTVVILSAAPYRTVQGAAKDLALCIFMNIRDSSFGLGRWLLRMTVSKSFSGTCLAVERLIDHGNPLSSGQTSAPFQAGALSRTSFSTIVARV
jgi:hypothetical protein